MKSILKNSSDHDGGKRILSSAADLVRRLDEGLRRAKTVPEIFSATNNGLRLRLRELCEQVILADPEDNGKKAEDLLWRKVYYEPYSFAKQIGQTLPLGQFESRLLTGHLLAGLGGYQQLTFSLEAQLAVRAGDRVDLGLCQPLGMTRETVTVRPSESSGQVSAWGQAALQRVLTSMGDLARYLSDLRPAEYPAAVAARYYNQAVLISPSVGRPHNQLGTLAGPAVHGLEAAYHYLRCMTCDDAFDGGRVNLKKLLEKNHARRVELEMEYGNSEVPPRRRLIISFLDVIYGATLLEGAKQHRFVRMCQETLQWLSFCLQPSPTEGGVVSINGQPLGETLDSRTVLLIVAVVVLALQTLKEDAAPASGLRAFLLAAFSCLVSRVTARLTGQFPALSAAAQPETAPAAPAPAAAPAAGQARSRARRERRARRRPPPGLPEESDEEEDGPLSDEALSGSELDSDSLDSLESDLSDSENEEPAESASDRPSVSELTDALKDEGLLVPLRLCCDWLRANEEVLKSCTESSANLWRQLVTLVNAVTMEITAESRVDGLRAEFVRQLASSAVSLAQTTPLWEDRLLRGVHLLGTRHQHMVWTDPLRQSLSAAEEVVLRVQLLVDFTTWLTSVPQLGVTFKAGKFVHVSNNNTTEDNNNETTQNDTETGERRRQLMTTMAEQWLRSEVRSLRCRTARRGGEASFSPYVVVDTAALVSHLASLKQMVKARQFLTVVPSAVIHELDERKATCSGAREASRWLETQFRRGNRFLRPQRANEKASLQLVKYPRRKQREQWHFFQILECCSHLSQSVPAAEPGAPASVTLLVGADETAAPGREFSPRGLASAAGIHFELITTFHSKWAVSSKGRS